METEATLPALPAPLVELEARLRRAMLAGDADALDKLVADDVLFADQQGALLTKAADLAAHRSGTLQLHEIRVLAQEGRLLSATTAVVAVLAEVAGTYGGQPFRGPARYVRVWAERHGCWQIAGGSVSQVPIAGEQEAS